MLVDTREAIRATFMRMYVCERLDRITVKMVCEKAGVSRQALYNHFYSLTNLFCCYHPCSVRVSLPRVECC